MDLDKLVNEIKRKRILRNIDDIFVRKMVEDYLKEHSNIRAVLEKHPKPEKSREFKVLLKSIRRELHEVYGVFSLGNKRERLLDNLRDHLKSSGRLDEGAIEIHKKILLTHRSTRERIFDYKKVYKKIFEATEPKSILDISCGMNPFSYPFMGLGRVDYIATELTERDCNFIKEYFSTMKDCSGLNGRVIKVDLLVTKRFPKTDICFLFKVLDSLERLKKNASHELLKKIKSELIIVSFPTKTLSGKKLDKKRLAWFNKLARDFETFETGNEIFYIIKPKHY